jgi:hypothetical protein
VSDTQEKAEYPPETVAIARVRGTEITTVLRRETSVGFDWAHTLVDGYTCSHDDEVIVLKVLLERKS